MFSTHFPNIFSPYDLMDRLVVARDYCCRFAPHKVSYGNRDKLNKELPSENIYVTPSSM